MKTDYADSLFWRVTLTASGGGEGVVEGVRVRVGPHCSGVIPKGCPHKFHHIVEQNVIGSARIVCLCLHSRSENRSTFSTAAEALSPTACI